MSCEKCRETYEIDGIEPQCIEGQCIIPAPDERGRRILEIRARIMDLAGLVDGGAILKLYDADQEDIRMLAFLESELKALRDEGNGEKDKNA